MDLLSAIACDDCAERHLGPSLHARHEQQIPARGCGGCGQPGLADGGVRTYRFTYWYPWRETPAERAGLV